MKSHPKRDLFAGLLANDALMGPWLLVARLFTTGIFVFYIVNLITKMPGPAPLIYLAVVVQFVGVVLVALGYETRFGALLLAACTLASLTFRGHFGFDNYIETVAQKDLALAGGFLFMFAYGPGPLSLDRFQNRRGLFTSLVRNEMIMGRVLLLGRMLSVIVFLFFGVSKILHTPRVQVFMVKHNPHVPTSLVYPAILTQILPPLLVLFGYKTRYAAFLLAGFCLMAPVLFWSDFGNPSSMEQFFLDFATAGGLVFMFAQGPGALSLDARSIDARPPRR